LKGYDEPEILPYSTRRNCLIGADAGHDHDLFDKRTWSDGADAWRIIFIRR
jgi:hypothetical protein